MYAHSVFDQVFIRIIILVPQEPEKIPVLLANSEAVKHLLDVHCNCKLFLSEAQQYPEQAVRQVGSCVQSLVQ